MEKGKAYLLVRSQVSDEGDRSRFDEWYRTHHLVFAKETFGAEAAWRFWSYTDAAIHFALYQFPSIEEAQKRLASDQLQILLDDFDSAWPQVQRTRELIEQVQ